MDLAVGRGRVDDTGGRVDQRRRGGDLGRPGNVPVPGRRERPEPVSRGCVDRDGLAVGGRDDEDVVGSVADRDAMGVDGGRVGGAGERHLLTAQVRDSRDGDAGAGRARIGARRIDAEARPVRPGGSRACAGPGEGERDDHGPRDEPGPRSTTRASHCRNRRRHGAVSRRGFVDCAGDRPLRTRAVPRALERRAPARVMARGRARGARRLERARRRACRGRRDDSRARPCRCRPCAARSSAGRTTTCSRSPRASPSRSAPMPAGSTTG